MEKKKSAGAKVRAATATMSCSTVSHREAKVPYVPLDFSTASACAALRSHLVDRLCRLQVNGLLAMPVINLQ